MVLSVQCAVVLTLGMVLSSLGAESDPSDYLRIVRSYADAMIEHGRDVYGTVHSPLFAAALDRKTLMLPEKEPPAIPGIRAGDRTLGGANPMHDENLYQVLYALTKVTGDACYSKAADEALKWFFEHSQSPTTGLFAWGEHIGWGFRTEAVESRHLNHEFYRPWVLWDRSFELAPEACRRFARGLWEHQIGDRTQGLFSRHARYDRHSPDIGADFPRHGGFYIATWAAAYERTKDPELLKAIEALVNGFSKRRNAQTGAIPSTSKSPDVWWPPSELSLAVDVWDAAAKVPPEPARMLRVFAARTDEVYLGVAQDLTPQGRGFLWAGSTRSLAPSDTKNRSYTDLWATGYGDGTDAQVAMLCLIRYRQVKQEGYRSLVLAAANRYLTSEPKPSTPLYPGAMGDAIALMLGAYRLTGDAKYLARAEAFGQMSVRTFFDGSPLPRASTKHEHYEAITRADTLIMELLDLWAVRTKQNPDLGLVYSER